MKETLLDLDRLPTLEEMREFFKGNDFSTAFDISEFENFSEDETLVFNYTKKLIDEKWESLSGEMGLKSHSKYYGEDNPLIVLRDNIQNIVANEVLKLTDENYDSTELEKQILKTFDYDFEDTKISADNEKAIDDMLHNAVKTLMDVVQYEEIEKVVRKNIAYEDVDHRQYNNHRAQDFNRKWNHLRAKISVVYTQDIDEHKETSIDRNMEIKTEKKIIQEKFFSMISEEDKKLLFLKMDGLTQKQIAEKLGLKSQSAVAKRLQKIKEIFQNIA